MWPDAPPPRRHVAQVFNKLYTASPTMSWPNHMFAQTGTSCGAHLLSFLVGHSVVVVVVCPWARACEQLRLGLQVRLHPHRPGL